jgi:hypothetical protein
MAPFSLWPGDRFRDVIVRSERLCQADSAALLCRLETRPAATSPISWRVTFSRRTPPAAEAPAIRWYRSAQRRFRGKSSHSISGPGLPLCADIVEKLLLNSTRRNHGISGAFRLNH